MKPNFNFHCIVLLQLLYLCAACEELYNTEMVPPEGAIVFDGVITNEPPPYFFSLSKPSGGLGEYTLKIVVLIGLMMQKLLLLIRRLG